MEESKKAVEFFWSETFRSVLEVGDFHMPDKMDWTKNYTYPSWDELGERDFTEVSQSLNQEFTESLSKPSCACSKQACACSSGVTVASPTKGKLSEKQRNDEC
jgi:hypothetical protein